MEERTQRQTAAPRQAERLRDLRVPAWLEHELAEVRPRILICLGATAAQAIPGASFRVSRDRGQFFEWDRRGDPSGARLTRWYTRPLVGM